MEQKRKYDYIIWDWNGTLFNDMDACIKVMNNMLLERKMKPIADLEAYRKAFCFPIKEYYKNVGYDFKEESFEQLVACYIEGYEAICNECPLTKGALEALEYIKEKKMGQIIVSASRTSSLQKQMNPFHIEGYFEEILGLSDHYAQSKTQLAKTWIEVNQVDPKKVLVIGDSVHDFELSKAIGSDCLLVEGHESIDRLQETGAKVCSELSEMKEYV